MELITTHWNGFVHGTNTGKITFSLAELGKNPKGVLRFMDDTFGLVMYDIEGTSSPDGIIFRGKPTVQREDLAQGDITIDCKLTPEGNLRGHWNSTIGTGGTFIAYPFNETTGSVGDVNIPEQIFTKRTQLGFVQLYKDDIINVAEFIKKEFVGRQIVVTYQSYEKPERINYFDDFIKVNDFPSLTYLKLFVSELEGRGINRSITVELRAYGANELIIQGMTESWVLGRTHMTATYLKQYEDGIRNAVNKFLPAAQIIILLSMIVLMTTMSSVIEKVWLGIGTFIALHGAPRMFFKFFPNAVIRMGEDKPNFFEKILQKGGSWIMGFGLIVMTLVTERYAERVADSVQVFISALFSSGSP